MSMTLCSLDKTMPRSSRFIQVCGAREQTAHQRLRPNTSLKCRRATARHLARAAQGSYHAPHGPGAAPLHAA
jgi:hypothetical protein